MTTYGHNCWLSINTIQYTGRIGFGFLKRHIRQQLINKANKNKYQIIPEENNSVNIIYYLSYYLYDRFSYCGNCFVTSNRAIINQGEFFIVRARLCVCVCVRVPGAHPSLILWSCYWNKKLMYLIHCWIFLHFTNFFKFDMRTKWHSYWCLMCAKYPLKVLRSE
jgi:hypothetical protein